MTARPLFRAVTFAAAVLLLASGPATRGDAPEKPAAKKGKKKKKPAPKAKPGQAAPKTKSDNAPAPKAKKVATPWEEYRLVAPAMSMDIRHWSLPPVLEGGRLPDGWVPADPRLRKALAADKAAKADVARDVKTGWEMDDDTKELYKRGVKRLAKDGVGGAAANDDERMAKGLAGGLAAFGALLARDANNVRAWTKAAAAQAGAWREIVPIAASNAGPAFDGPPLRFELVVGPVRERSLRVTNIAGRDLRNVTFHVRTNLSATMMGDGADAFVFYDVWEAGKTRLFGRELVSKTMDVAHPVPFADAFRYSVWCDELRAEDVVMHLPVQRPRVEGGGTLTASVYRLAAPAKK